VCSEGNVSKLKEKLNKLSMAEYNFPIYVQTTYSKGGVNFYCGFKAWANSEVELMDTMRSGDRTAI